jgi:spermidine/putrescine transport system ATP-binding protein
MVFQNYALFPHMNVEQNTGYSLKLKGVPKGETKEAVAQALSLVRLSGFEKRKPSELSGGERQRVAVARSVINKPKVLLLDEPLGALDLQLRRQMQYELKLLQKQLGITFIYITHDQEEALTMSDRIAVMRNGAIEQIDSAEEIYNKPKTGFAARFVGGANILYGSVKAVSSFSDEDGEKISFCFEHPSGSAKIETVKSEVNIDIQEGKQIIIALREENISFLPCQNASSWISTDGLYATVTGKSFSAGLLRIFAQLDNSKGEEVKSSVQGINSELKTGDRVLVSWKPSNAVLLERE